MTTIEGVSSNLKYLFTDKGIIQLGDYYKTNNKKNIIEYSFENLHIALDILKEHKELYHKLNKISVTEYVNSSRKFLYELMETFNLKDNISIIKEWEEKFGSKLLLLNESTDKLLIEERVNNSWESIRTMLEEATWNPFSSDFYSKENFKGLGQDIKGAVKRVDKFAKDTAKSAVDWTKEQGRQISQKGLGGYLKDKAKSVFNSVKNAVAKVWKCLTNNPIECMMEGLRTAAFSALGMGALTALTVAFPGVGNIPDAIIFGSLLIWDIYKALSGKYESGEYKWSWTDIIVDAVCLILPALGGALKSALSGIKGFGELAVKASTKGGVFAKAVNTIKNGIGTIISLIGKAAAWIGQKLGIKWLSEFGGKAQSFMKNSADELITKVNQGVSKVKEIPGVAKEKLATAGKKIKQFSKTLQTMTPKRVIIKKSGTAVLLTAAFCAALGVDDPWMCQHKVESGQVSEEEINKIQNAINSKGFQNQLDQLSVDDAEKLGLI